MSEKGLGSLLNESKLIVSVGSGGVGKTTTAAALAIAAARQGKRTAVLTIDPARRLAQALGIEKMGNAPARLPDSLTGPGTVDAMMLETAACFDDLIARLVPDTERQERLLKNRLYQVLAKQLGGTHEYMAVEKLFALTSSGDYDLVILDTPPSVNALDFLDAPERLASFFSEKVTRFFVRDSEPKKGFFARMKDRAGDVAVSLLGKALGEVFMDDVRDFATAFQGLFKAFRERGTVINKLMADPGTHFLVVSGADPVRVAEALEFVLTLKKFHIRPRAFIANRVHLPLAADELSLEDLEASLKESLAQQEFSADESQALLDSFLRARALRDALARRDAAGLSILSEQTHANVHVVPELEDEVADRAAVEHVVNALLSNSERLRF